MSPKQRSCEAESQAPLLDAMAGWDGPPPLSMPWHRFLSVEVGLAREGKCCAALIGQQGVGKTYAVRQVRDAANRTRTELTPDLLGGEPEPVFQMTAATATTAKHGLRQILEGLSRWTMTESDIRRHDPAAMVRRIVDEMEIQSVDLIIIDEAQMLSAEAIDHVRLIYDYSAQIGRRAGIVFVGTPSLGDVLSKASQSGQRVPRPVKAVPFDRGWAEDAVPRMHPLLPGLSETLGKREWSGLLSEMVTVSGGKIRRLVEILRFANQVALQRSEPLTEVHIRAGMRLLATDSAKR